MHLYITEGLPLISEITWARTAMMMMIETVCSASTYNIDMCASLAAVKNICLWCGFVRVFSAVTIVHKWVPGANLSGAVRRQVGLIHLAVVPQCMHVNRYRNPVASMYAHMGPHTQSITPSGRQNDQALTVATPAPLAQKVMTTLGISSD